MEKPNSMNSDPTFQKEAEDITNVKKSELLRALESEIRRHSFDYFAENPAAMADAEHGVVVPGCLTCRKRINTMAQFLDHLADDVLPDLINKLSSAGSG